MKLLFRYISVLFITGLLCHSVTMSRVEASFEDIGAGARAVGMGNVFTSLADDVYSLYYNPAGLGQLKQREFTSSYGRLYIGLDDGSNLGGGFLGYVHPAKQKWGTFGFGWLNFHLADYYQENTFLFSYGRKFSKMLPVYAGLNLKILTKKYGADDYTKNDPVFADGYAKSGTSADLGFLWRLPYSFSAGLVLTDFLQPDMGLTTESKVPMGIKSGISYRSNSLNMAVEGSCRDKEIKIYTGAEIWFLKKSFALRTGLGIGDKRFTNISLGASYNVSLFHIDYAFLFPLSGISDMYGSHRLALSFRFGPLPPEEIEDTTILKKKITELEEKTKAMETMEQKIKNLEETKRKTEEELSKTKMELEKLKKEKVTPPPAVTPLPVKPSTPTVRTHRVEPGETLQSIATKYYGDERRWVDIYNANKDKIERGVVKQGQILIIP